MKRKLHNLMAPVCHTALLPTLHEEHHHRYLARNQHVVNIKDNKIDEATLAIILERRANKAHVSAESALLTLNPDPAGTRIGRKGCGGMIRSVCRSLHLRLMPATASVYGFEWSARHRGQQCVVRVINCVSLVLVAAPQVDVCHRSLHAHTSSKGMRHLMGHGLGKGVKGVAQLVNATKGADSRSETRSDVRSGMSMHGFDVDALSHQVILQFGDCITEKEAPTIPVPKKKRDTEILKVWGVGICTMAMAVMGLH